MATKTGLSSRIWGVILFIVLVLISLAGYAGLYHLPYAGTVSQISFDSDGVRLSGVLVKPTEEGIYPAIVLVHGSGPHTHDMPAYRIHANAFLRQNIAVLAYDKRGSGNSKGDFANASYADFVNDALQAIAFLRSRDDIDSLRIGLFGSSEGGWFTPEIAARAGNIAFIINRCGPPLSWRETNLFEIRNELLGQGLPTGDISAILRVRERIWDYYIDTSEIEGHESGSQREQLNLMLDTVFNQYNGIDLPLPRTIPEFDPDRFRRFAMDYSYDPTPYIDSLATPSLWVFGELDENVPSDSSIEALTSFHSYDTGVIEFRLYPGVGHSLQTWWRVLDAGYPDGYLTFIGEWGNSHVADRSP